MLLEIIEQAPDKLIVFAPWRHLIENLSALLTEHEIDHAMVHGNVNKRELIFNDFQNTTRYRVLLAHPQCVHHGLTLTAATTTVWYSPTPSLEIYEQGNARIRRVGQTRKQLFLHLQSTAVERKVYGMLRSKQNVQDKFLQLIKTAINGDDHG
jgi:SNF2 family DNA or RNA helicase